MFEISCLRCGHTLHSSRDLVPTKDVLKASGSKCPKCGATLAIDRFRVEIESLETKAVRVAESPPAHLWEPSMPARPTREILVGARNGE